MLKGNKNIAKNFLHTLVDHKILVKHNRENNFIKNLKISIICTNIGTIENLYKVLDAK